MSFSESIEFETGQEAGQTADQNGPQAALEHEFVLGDWVIQPETNKVCQRGGTLERHLEPRLMRLLCFLAANPGSVLSRDALVQELWPRVIVNENSLTRAVSELRKSLQLPGQTGDLIQTIPKKGYRLSQPVAFAADAGEQLPMFSANLAGRPQQAIMASLCLTLLLGLGYGIAQQLTVGSYAEPVLLSDEVMEPENDYFAGEVTLSKATDDNFLGDSETPQLSQQGNQYAYIEYGQTGSTIFLGNLDEMTEPVAVLNSGDKLFNLAWSPLGNSLLFARKPPLTAALYSSDMASELYSLDLESLTLRRLVEAPLIPEPEQPSGRNLT